MNLIIIALAALIAVGGSLGAGRNIGLSTSPKVVAPVAAAVPEPTDTPAPTPMDIAVGGGPSAPLP